MFKKLLVLPLITALSLTACTKKSTNPLEELYADTTQCHIKAEGGDIPTLYFLLLEHRLEGENRTIKLSNAEIMEQFRQTIKKGCDVNEPRKEATYPIAFAVATTNDEAIKILMENGANPALKMTTKSEITNGKDTFEYSKALLIKNNTPERIKTDELIQSYKK